MINMDRVRESKLPKIKKTDKVTLYVIDGANGLPSADPLTSQLLFLLKLHNIKNVEVKTVRCAIFSDYPRLEFDGKIISHPYLIRRQIEQLTLNTIDLKYNSIDRNRILAYKVVIQNYIELYTLLNGWGTEENIAASVKYYSRGMYFPFRLFYVRNLRRRMKQLVDCYCREEHLEVYMEQVFKTAPLYLNDFANLLGRKKYLFGDDVSTLDVHLCSFLAQVMVLRFPNTTFQNIILNSTQTLEPYIYKFMDTYGLLSEKEPEEVENDRAPALMIITAGFFAMSAMIGFAFIHGLIK